jgi:hypothetical protein
MLDVHPTRREKSVQDTTSQELRRRASTIVLLAAITGGLVLVVALYIVYYRYLRETSVRRCNDETPTPRGRTSQLACYDRRLGCM